MHIKDIRAIKFIQAYFCNLAVAKVLNLSPLYSPDVFVEEM